MAKEHQEEEKKRIAENVRAKEEAGRMTYQGGSGSGAQNDDDESAKLTPRSEKSKKDRTEQWLQAAKPKGSAEVRGSLSLPTRGREPLRVNLDQFRDSQFIVTDQRLMYSSNLVPRILSDMAAFIIFPDDRKSGVCLHVSGFPISWPENQVVHFCYDYGGTITGINMFRFDDGCPQGCGLVQFMDHDTAKKFKQQHGRIFNKDQWDCSHLWVSCSNFLAVS